MWRAWNPSIYTILLPVIEFMDRQDLPYVVEPMRVQDIAEVVEIERVSFPSPWPPRAYRYEVNQNRLAHYFVARERSPEASEEEAEERDSGLMQWMQHWTHGTKTQRPSVVGYCGFWIAADEAHISTIAVDPKHRAHGLGQLLLVTAIERAIQLNARLMSLEVRVSNFAAQSLYHKYGFKVVGSRPRYYSDNREDALIMTADHITSAPYQRLLQKRRTQLIQRLRRVPIAASQE